MDHRRLGGCGLLVSSVGLGCMGFGRETDEAEARAMVSAFLDAGGNFLDTADSYHAGASERILGRAVAGIRDEVVIATKVGIAAEGGPNRSGASRRHVIASCHRSLANLGTDYIDLYQLHCWDELTPLEETLAALEELVRAGKVRYVGVSNYTGWQLMKASLLSASVPVVTVQSQYSLLERTIERDLVPACVDRGVGLLAWGPLAGGLLSGKYRPAEPFPSGSRFAEWPDWMPEYWSAAEATRNWAVLEAVRQTALETGRTPGAVALGWLRTRRALVAPIVGARTAAQLRETLAGFPWTLEECHARRLDELSAPPVEYPQRFSPAVLRPRLDRVRPAPAAGA